MPPIETRRFGDVTLIRGDCLKVMLSFEQKSISMIFADLPYGSKQTRCAWDKPFDMPTYWSSVWRICFGNVCMTATQPFTTALINSCPKFFKYTLVWNKKFSGAFANAKYQPMRTHEDIAVFFKKRGIYNPQMLPRDKPIKNGANRLLSDSIGSGGVFKPDGSFARVYSEKYPTTILDISIRDRFRGLHPTQKPVALLEWLIRTYTNDGDTILDPVAGSATTAIAAMNVGNRKVICIEKDPTFFEIMTKRVADHQKALADAQA